MRFFKEYIEYIQDNPEGYWFKRKLYGWGWVPARWAGWLTLSIYVAFILWIVNQVSADIEEAAVLSHILGPVLGATLILLSITWRTGEPPKWQWGKPSNKE